MASWERLRNKIVEKLQSVNSIAEVEEYPTNEMTGYPCAMLETVRNESEFESTTQNRRTYVFNIYIVQEIESAGGMKQARRIIQSAIDDVLDVFDRDQTLEGVEMPDNEVLIITIPALSRIYTDAEAKNVVGLVELKVVTSFSIR